MRLNYLILFLLSPLASLLVAFRNSKPKAIKYVFALFSFFYGFVFPYEDPALGTFSQDSATYVRQFNDIRDELGSGEFSFQNSFKSKVDYYSIASSLVIASLTDDVRFLWGFYSLVLGILIIDLYTTVRSNLADNLVITNPLVYWLVLLFILFQIPLWSINGVRMWTAAMFFIVGSVRFLKHGDRISGALLILLSVLVHFSMAPIIGLFLLIWILPKNIYLYYTVLILSMVYSTSGVEIIKGFINLDSELLVQERLGGYVNEDYAVLRREAFLRSSWFIRYEITAMSYACFLFYSYIVFKPGWISSLATRDSLFIILGIVSLAFAQFTLEIPSGSRYLRIAFYLSVLAFANTLRLKTVNDKRHIMFSLPLIAMIIYRIAFELRIGSDYLVSDLIFSNIALEFLF